VSFDPGSRLGPYEIVSQLGAGGMGEVYRARDTRLDRTVAVKVLTGGVAADAESRLRFEQEARAIAALNDPRICTIHDVGRANDLDYLVLEYLEGETLAARIRRQPSLTIPESLAIAIEIAEALDRAHRAGIVHRDLKPGNVMLVRRSGTPTPQVKLLDFGLAAMTAAAPRPKPADASMNVTMAATLSETRPASATPVSSGFSGTVQYMAPEQAEGEIGDHRVDIFAFGCVLYEMLSGRKAFVGNSILTVVAAVMNSEPPPIDALRSHPHLDHVLRRCLEKDREGRWQSIRDVAAELRWILEKPEPSSSAAAPSPPRSRMARLAVPLAAAVVLPALAIAAYAVTRQPEAVERPLLHFTMPSTPSDDPGMALSADGKRLVYVANRDRVPMLWVRTLDDLEPRALPRTEGASSPFWSPDGRSVGFFADGKLKRIDVDGGEPLVLADAANGRGGAWGPDGVILFSPGVNDPIMRVSTRGGRAEPATKTGGDAGPDHRFPQFLPGGRSFLFSSTLGQDRTNGIYLASVDGGTPRRLLSNAGAGRFVMPGWLLTARQGNLQAYRFDPQTGAVEGEPTVIAQGLSGGIAAVATSDTGIVAYRRGAGQLRQLAWVDRNGSVQKAIGEPSDDATGSPELSPDEQAVVVFSQRDGGENDIWVIELARNLARRLTSGPPADAHPLWDPDGRHVVFSTSRLGGERGPVRQAANGGKPQELFSAPQVGWALSWTPDRRYLLIRAADANNRGDLFAVETGGNQTRLPVTQSDADDSEGQFSPDGKWVAIVSSEGVRREVFLQSFPEPATRIQISNGGGSQVRWSSNGKELFYIAPDGKMMSVQLALEGPTPVAQLPVPLFQTYLATGTNVVGNKAQYAVSRDGRFLLNTRVEREASPIVVMVNWMERAK
jgi:serine/threonine protein kinase/Tol biopolymer transport system component